MKKWTIIGCQWILGLIFILAGLNGLVVFFGMEPFMPTSPKAMELFKMKYLLFFEKSTETLLGVLLIWGRFIPFVLGALSPIIANILAFHIFEDMTLLPLAIVITLLEVYLLWIYRQYYESIFVYKARPFK
ncbi:hypothetical protein [Shimazuella alba]|uniref:DoxX-like family protein n=1 Tax=Shimazuella alba TaxID=2690964 RepID=A0A6I4VM01_9BACL|nr:hypothetical protein [Shimazuella alba]MXQ52447.1 hypothetical protein [Shimazuella alba]